MVKFNLDNRKQKTYLTKANMEVPRLALIATNSRHGIGGNALYSISLEKTEKTPSMLLKWPKSLLH